MDRPPSQRELQRVDQAVRQDRSRDYHKAANLMAEASRLVAADDRTAAEAIYEQARALREKGQAVLSIDG